MKSVLVLVLAILGAATGCQFPPSLWCETREIAEQCKVLDQCKAFVWQEMDYSQAPKVNLELYFESLCPDCQQFITTQLYPTFQKIGDIMNITLVPYGNADERKQGDKWVFQCQHGVQECIGNLLETCSIHYLQTMPKIMPFIYCMESSGEHPMSSFKACAQKLSVPLSAISAIWSCYNGSQGNELEHQMALRTDALVPSHQYVPWIVFNGVHTEKINDRATSNLLKLICETYKGPKPAACKKPETQRASMRFDVL